ncbi:YueI family protein [Bacillus sp. BRMEA1]|uniref:YueI family protein n=1 Tax=Neobacillus endophyticus TaxID=2738405 RepID=UPI001562FEBF|nr:YueI family protein [Neobacillus endophyticus]NRD77706.1 YueI family protein [Neobacillus endophyticus]
MKKPTVEDVLNQGIYGPLETKPEERREFLGTLRERVIVVLTKRQVAEPKVYPQIEKFMKEYPKARLFLNGGLSYGELSKYIKIAAKMKVEHTIVTNKSHDTEMGLVLAMDFAIDKEDIYLTKNIEPIKVVKKNKSLLQKIFKKRKKD